MLFLASHFPYSAVGLSPVSFDCPNYRFDQIVVLSLRYLAAMLVREVKSIKQDPVNIELKLIPGTVAYPDGRRAFVSLEMAQRPFSENSFAAYPEHNLHVFYCKVENADQPIQVGALRFVVTNRMKGPKYKRRIAYPRISVIPVSATPYLLWQ